MGCLFANEMRKATLRETKDGGRANKRDKRGRIREHPHDHNAHSKKKLTRYH